MLSINQQQNPSAHISAEREGKVVDRYLKKVGTAAGHMLSEKPKELIISLGQKGWRRVKKLRMSVSCL